MSIKKIIEEARANSPFGRVSRYCDIPERNRISAEDVADWADDYASGEDRSTERHLRPAWHFTVAEDSSGHWRTVELDCFIPGAVYMPKPAAEALAEHLNGASFTADGEVPTLEPDDFALADEFDEFAGMDPEGW